VPTQVVDRLPHTRVCFPPLPRRSPVRWHHQRRVRV